MSKSNFKDIKRVIEMEICHVHNKKPTFIESNNDIDIIACCDDFKTKMVEKFSILIAERSIKNVENIFKKAFK
ncbi:MULTISPECIES: hypothetical protein [Empedobacter]|uniref:Uncharacterized protein n=1 Tax=Empedobacter falsenii TaxID=343874 RepID=A0AAW7DGG7_9FLAO|nr:MULTISPECIES: hypothetical protein [Empedobacter]MDM1550566.1 hypothetical protein [Empedobacter falsenii]